MGPSTLASWPLLIARALMQRGIDAEAVFRRANMSPAKLRDANARYPFESMQRLWGLTAEATRDPCFGLEVGRLWHPTTFHALGYAALASASLREALTYVVRYCRIVTTGAILDLIDCGAEVKLRLASRAQAQSLPTQSMRMPAQAGLAAIATLCRVARGEPVQLVRVTFADGDGGCGARLESFFGCLVLFNAEDNALVFRAHDLDAPLPTVNSELVRINRQLLGDYLASLESSELAMRVRAQLTRLLPSGEARQAAVAFALNLSQRSLQRKLKLEGVSFRRLLDETRRELARQYFKDSTLSVAEVGYLLGFSETSSLSRAARRWTAAVTSARA
jgi:AraC-like DNA-binding protein